MINLRKLALTTALSLSATFAFAGDTNKATQLIQKLHDNAGGWNKLASQKDVEFDYLYSYADGKQDVSVERYIFDGEHSWAKYTKHEINVFPGKEGDVIQSLVDNKAATTLNGEAMEAEEAVFLSDFLRRANFFWFTMNFKLVDPGTIHEYLGTETVNGTSYKKVKVSYNSSEVGKEVNDGYIVYINPETGLVDQFLFSLPTFGVNEPTLKMVVTYADINGLKIPVKREMFQPNEQGVYGDQPALTQESLNVKFNNGFTPESFKI